MAIGSIHIALLLSSAMLYGVVSAGCAVMDHELQREKIFTGQLFRACCASPTGDWKDLTISLRTTTNKDITPIFVHHDQDNQSVAVLQYKSSEQGGFIFSCEFDNRTIARRVFSAYTNLAEVDTNLIRLSCKFESHENVTCSFFLDEQHYCNALFDLYYSLRMEDNSIISKKASLGKTYRDRDKFTVRFTFAKNVDWKSINITLNLTNHVSRTSVRTTDLRYTVQNAKRLFELNKARTCSPEPACGGGFNIVLITYFSLDCTVTLTPLSTAFSTLPKAELENHTKTLRWKTSHLDDQIEKWRCIPSLLPATRYDVEAICSYLTADGFQSANHDEETTQCYTDETAPRTVVTASPGAFFSQPCIVESNCRNVTVYWKPLPLVDWGSGQNLTYELLTIEASSCPSYWPNVTHTVSYLHTQAQVSISQQKSVICIRARNRVGISRQIREYQIPAANTVPAAPQLTLRYFNEKLHISWKPVKRILVKSYIIYWCLDPKQQSKGQCEQVKSHTDYVGSVSYSRYSADTRHVQLSMRRYWSTYQVAIAVETNLGYSGMNWVLNSQAPEDKQSITKYIVVVVVLMLLAVGILIILYRLHCQRKDNCCRKILKMPYRFPDVPKPPVMSHDNDPPIRDRPVRYHQDAAAVRPLLNEPQTEIGSVIDTEDERRRTMENSGDTPPSTVPENLVETKAIFNAQPSGYVTISVNSKNQAVYKEEPVILSASADDHIPSGYCQIAKDDEAEKQYLLLGMRTSLDSPSLPSLADLGNVYEGNEPSEERPINTSGCESTGVISGTNRASNTVPPPSSHTEGAVETVDSSVGSVSHTTPTSGYVSDVFLRTSSEDSTSLHSLDYNKHSITRSSRKASNEPPALVDNVLHCNEASQHLNDAEYVRAMPNLLDNSVSQGCTTGYVTDVAVYKPPNTTGGVCQGYVSEKDLIVHNNA